MTDVHCHRADSYRRFALQHYELKFTEPREVLGLFHLTVCHYHCQDSAYVVSLHVYVYAECLHKFCELSECALRPL